MYRIGNFQQHHSTPVGLDEQVSLTFRRSIGTMLELQTWNYNHGTDCQVDGR